MPGAPSSFLLLVASKTPSFFQNIPCAGRHLHRLRALSAPPPSPPPHQVPVLVAVSAFVAVVFVVMLPLEGRTPGAVMGRGARAGRRDLEAQDQRNQAQARWLVKILFPSLVPTSRPKQKVMGTHLTLFWMSPSWGSRTEIPHPRCIFTDFH